MDGGRAGRKAGWKFGLRLDTVGEVCNAVAPEIDTVAAFGL